MLYLAYDVENISFVAHFYHLHFVRSYLSLMYFLSLAQFTL